jgi:hypothetical protein
MVCHLATGLAQKGPVGSRRTSLAARWRQRDNVIAISKYRCVPAAAKAGLPMTEEFLNRDYLLAISAAVAERLEHEADLKKNGNGTRRRSSDPLAENAPGELKEFAEALREMRSSNWCCGDRHRPAPPRPRRGQTGLQKEDSVYIPRDPVRIIQSAVEEAVKTHEPDAVDEPPPVPDGRRAARPIPTITDRRLKNSGLVVAPERRVWKAFEVASGGWIWLSDPRRALSVAHKLWRNATDNFAPFVAAPRTVTLEDDARIFLVGDWGSGIDRACRVADQIKREMKRSGGRQQVVIHLGDVYYSGAEREFAKAFSRSVAGRLCGGRLVVHVPGNHNMYSGGTRISTGLSPTPDLRAKVDVVTSHW